jgi:hypothetical protein
VLSHVVSNPEWHPLDRSPTFDADSKDQLSLPRSSHSSQGEDHNRDQSSLHQHLPSFSDMFSGQMLPYGMRPPSKPNGYRFSGARVVGPPGHAPHHSTGDARPPPVANGQPYVDNASSHPSFSQPRPPLDGPLPIHALLASKPEPTFHASQPPALHYNPYHLDQEPTRLAH